MSTDESTGPPATIYLQYHGDADPADYPDDPEPDLSEVSWCATQVFPHDVAYIRKDLVRAMKRRKS